MTAPRPKLHTPEPIAVLRALLLMLAVVVALCGPAGAANTPPAPQEYQLVKAAFLYNFSKFIDWPNESQAKGAAPVPFTVCIFGSDPFGDAFDSINGKNVKSRTLQIRRVLTVEELKECHILYIGASEKKRMSNILKAVRGAHLLTVSDVDGFYEAGGMIALATEKNRVQFRINNSAAQRAGLRISSQLLRLATDVD